MNGHVTECGVMNFFVYWINKNKEKEIITCSLDDGTILSGVTRDSVIGQCKEWGIKVCERPFTAEELVTAISEGRVLEAFGTGTAAVICPINKISHENKVLYIFEFLGFYNYS
jgi:branched-chain amino acid aminotransferase